MKTRFKNAKSIEGTRGFRSFRPLSRSKISAKRVSFDDEEQIFEMFAEITNVPTSNISEFNQGMFVACTYDREWFIGTVVEVNAVHDVVKIKFMNKNMKINSFSWPVHDDICWIPASNILCGINTLLPRSVVRRVYSVSTKEYNKISQAFHCKQFSLLCYLTLYYFFKK